MAQLPLLSFSEESIFHEDPPANELNHNRLQDSYKTSQDITYYSAQGYSETPTNHHQSHGFVGNSSRTPPDYGMELPDVSLGLDFVDNDDAMELTDDAVDMLHDNLWPNFPNVAPPLSGTKHRLEYVGPDQGYSAEPAEELVPVKCESVKSGDSPQQAGAARKKARSSKLSVTGTQNEPLPLGVIKEWPDQLGEMPSELSSQDIPDTDIGQIVFTHLLKMLREDKDKSTGIESKPYEVGVVWEDRLKLNNASPSNGFSGLECQLVVSNSGVALHLPREHNKSTENTIHRFIEDCAKFIDRKRNMKNSVGTDSEGKRKGKGKPTKQRGKGSDETVPAQRPLRQLIQFTKHSAEFIGGKNYFRKHGKFSAKVGDVVLLDLDALTVSPITSTCSAKTFIFGVCITSSLETHSRVECDISGTALVSLETIQRYSEPDSNIIRIYGRELGRFEKPSPNESNNKKLIRVVLQNTNNLFEGSMKTSLIGDRAYPITKVDPLENILKGDIVAEMPDHRVKGLMNCNREERNKMINVLVCSSFPDTPLALAEDYSGTGSPTACCAMIGLVNVNLPDDLVLSDPNTDRFLVVQRDTGKCCWSVKDSIENSLLVGKVFPTAGTSIPVSESQVRLYVNVPMRDDSIKQDIRLDIPDEVRDDPLECAKQLYVSGTREWVFQSIQQWANENNSVWKIHGGNLLRVVGAPAMGKTVIAAQLVSRSDLPPVVAYHFFLYSNHLLSDAITCICSLNRQICQRIPQFRQKWLSQAEKLVSSQTTNWGIATWFHNLVVIPASGLTVTSRYLCVLDALDECNMSERFIKVLNSCTLPSWLGLVYTCRSSLYGIQDSATNIRTIEISPSSKDNIQDLRVCLQKDHDLRDKPLELEKRVEECEGIILVASNSQLSVEATRLDTNSKPVSVLTRFHEANLHRMQRSMEDIQTGSYVKTISPLVAARVHLPLGIWNLSMEESNCTTLAGTTQGVVVFQKTPSGEQLVSLQHKSVNDYLMNPFDVTLAVDVTQGHRSLGMLCYELWTSTPNPTQLRQSAITSHQRFAVSEALYHLVNCNDPRMLEVATTLALDFEYLLCRLKWNNDPCTLKVELQLLWDELLRNGIETEQLDHLEDVLKTVSSSVSALTEDYNHIASQLIAQIANTNHPTRKQVESHSFGHYWWRPLMPSLQLNFDQLFRDGGGHGKISALAISEHWVISTTADGIVHVWELATGVKVVTLQHEEERDARCVSISSDESNFAVLYAPGTVVVWTLDGTDTNIGIITHERIAFLAFHPTCATKLAIAFNNEIRELSILDQEDFVTFGGGKQEEPLCNLTYNADGSLLASTNSTGVLSVWFTKDATLMCTIDLEWNASIHAEFAPSGTTLAVCCQTKVFVWDAIEDHQSRKPNPLPETADPVKQMCFVTDSVHQEAVYIALLFDSTLQIWNPQSLSMMKEIECSSVINCTAASQRYLVCGALDDNIYLWTNRFKERISKPLVNQYNRHPSPIVTVDMALTREGAILLTADFEGTILLWNITDGSQVWSSPLVDLALCFTSLVTLDSTLLVCTGSSNGTVRLWNAMNKTQVDEKLQHSSKIASVAMHSTDRSATLAVSMENNTICLWHRRHKRLKRLSFGWQFQRGISWETPHVVNGMKFSISGRSLVGCLESNICCWDVSSGKQRNGIVQGIVALHGIRLENNDKVLVASAAPGIYLNQPDDIALLQYFRLDCSPDDGLVAEPIPVPKFGSDVTHTSAGSRIPLEFESNEKGGCVTSSYPGYCVGFTPLIESQGSSHDSFVFTSPDSSVYAVYILESRVHTLRLCAPGDNPVSNGSSNRCIMKRAETTLTVVQSSSWRTAKTLYAEKQQGGTFRFPCFGRRSRSLDCGTSFIAQGAELCQASIGKNGNILALKFLESVQYLTLFVPTMHRVGIYLVQYHATLATKFRTIVDEYVKSSGNRKAHSSVTVQEIILWEIEIGEVRFEAGKEALCKEMKSSPVTYHVMVFRIYLRMLSCMFKRLIENPRRVMSKVAHECIIEARLLESARRGNVRNFAYAVLKFGNSLQSIYKEIGIDYSLSDVEISKQLKSWWEPISIVSEILDTFCEEHGVDIIK